MSIHAHIFIYILIYIYIYIYPSFHTAIHCSSTHPETHPSIHRLFVFFLMRFMCMTPFRHVCSGVYTYKQIQFLQPIVMKVQKKGHVKYIQAMPQLVPTGLGCRQCNDPTLAANMTILQHNSNTPSQMCKYTIRCRHIDREI